jgi:hypothetical protein
MSEILGIKSAPSTPFDSPRDSPSGSETEGASGVASPNTFGADLIVKNKTASTVQDYFKLKMEAKKAAMLASIAAASGAVSPASSLDVASAVAFEEPVVVDSLPAPSPEVEAEASGSSSESAATAAAEELRSRKGKGKAVDDEDAPPAVAAVDSNDKAAAKAEKKRLKAEAKEEAKRLKKEAKRAAKQAAKSAEGAPLLIPRARWLVRLTDFLSLSWHCSRHAGRERTVRRGRGQEGEQAVKEALGRGRRRRGRRGQGGWGRRQG